MWSMNDLVLAWRLLRRDLRAGELTALALALVLAIGALTGVAFLADRLERALRLDAHRLLGGDLLLIADRPWPEEHAREAARRGLRVAYSAVFPSMVFTGGGAQLAEVKAVSADYPLRGELRIAVKGGDAEGRVSPGPPAAGEVWLEDRLARTLAVTPGAEVGLGQLKPRFAAILVAEPERGFNAFALAPRLMMSLDDLPASGLLQPGSRVRWCLHLAGDEARIAGFRAWVEPRLGRGERIEDLDNARPELRSLLERAQRFLRLAALLTVVLAAVAALLAARRYVERHLDGCALLRCLGARQRQLLRLHGGEFILFGLVCVLIGSLLGFAAQAVLIAMLGGLIGEALPPPSLWPLALALAVGTVLIGGFVLPPLARLASVPTLGVLRREWQGGDVRPARRAWAVGALALIALVFWLAGDARLALVTVAGFAVAAVLFAAAAWLFVVLAGRLPLAGGWRLGTTSLRRQGWDALLQIVALALGAATVLLLMLARGDFLAAWRMRLPLDAPNRFVLNIQPEQRTAISEFFTARGLSPPVMAPMVRGRLVSINGRSVRGEDWADERARRLVEREFNLSWAAEVPPGNEIVAGRWPGREGETRFSVEQGLAEILGVRLHDRLGFEIGGVRLPEIEVGALRRLDWDSMRVNFFVIATPGLLNAQPASYITSFHLPRAQAALVDELVARWPNLTVVDVEAIVRQIANSFDRVAAAVQTLFGFALLTGFIVLLAAIQASAAARCHELALLRCLGARRHQLEARLIGEFAWLGLLAGLLGALAAIGVGWALMHFVFRLPQALPSLWPLAVGPLLGALGVALAGRLAMRHVLAQPALGALRDAG